MKILNPLKINSRHWKNAVSNDVLRPIMTGVYFDLVEKVMVATNSHLLLMIPLEIEWSQEEIKNLTENERNQKLKNESKIVELELFDERKYMGDVENYLFPIHFDLSDENYAQVFNGHECVFRCRYIDGKFPNYLTVIPKESEPKESIGVCIDMVLRIYKAIPSKEKNIKFFFSKGNQAIRFEAVENIKGVVMPVISL